MPAKGPEMPCGWCGKPQTARTMRDHFSECEKKPVVITKAQERLRAFAARDSERERDA